MSRYGRHQCAECEDRGDYGHDDATGERIYCSCPHGQHEKALDDQIAECVRVDREDVQP